MKGFNITRKELDKLVAEGKLRGYTWPTDKKTGKPVARNMNPMTQQKKAMIIALHEWGMKKGIIILKEFQFDAERKFAFDFCFIIAAIDEKPEIKVAVEYEGIMSKKSGHTTRKGFTSNTEKYNLAQSLGWRVYRYTPLNHKNIEQDLNKLIVE